jgi:hypothetical protein
VIVVLQDVGLSHGEVPIEDIEEFAFDTTDVTSSEYPRTQGPVVVLDRPVVDILWVRGVESTVNVAGGTMRSNTHFIGELSAPRKTRSQAHSGDWMKRCCLALLIHTKETSIVGILTSERWTAFEANMRI